MDRAGGVFSVSKESVTDQGTQGGTKIRQKVDTSGGFEPQFHRLSSCPRPGNCLGFVISDFFSDL
jgi:hypothetical protein